MKTQNTYTSKIATLVYANYTENVDMNNKCFKQSELNALVKNDKSILRVDYYINGVIVGNVMYSEKQAIAQVLKMNETQAKIYDKMEREAGSDWYGATERNKTRQAKIQGLYTKMAIYKNFISEEGFDNSEIPIMFCQDYDVFINP